MSLDRREASSKGGIAWAKIQKERALEGYYKNPNICKNCGEIIKVKENQRVAEVRIKNFCNHSCSTSYNNKNRKIGKQCKVEQKQKIGKIDTFGNLTRLELYTRSKNNYTARSAISKNARVVYRKSSKHKFCKNCGYDRYYEVCHIKPVSDFKDSSLIKEINDLNNLIALCPNCHWEHDNLHNIK